MLMKNEPILRSHRRAEPPGVRAVSGEMREVERKEEIMMAPTARRDFFRGENYQESEGEMKNEGMTSLVTLPSLSMSSSLETESTETGLKVNPLELLLVMPMLIFNTNEKKTNNDKRWAKFFSERRQQFASSSTRAGLSSTGVGTFSLFLLLLLLSL